MAERHRKGNRAEGLSRDTKTREPPAEEEEPEDAKHREARESRAPEERVHRRGDEHGNDRGESAQ